MKDIPKISESEWRVMKVLWARSSATANEVIEALSDKTSWNPKTTRTLLGRLVRKKALGFERHGREYHYFPLVSEHTCVRAESRSFLKRVYGGSLRPMLAAFLQEQNLSQEEISELKRILDEKGRR